MNAFLLSTITLITELAIAGLLFYTVYIGYKKGKLLRGLAYFSIAYEIVFNIGYMIYRSAFPSQISESNPNILRFGMFHGILSLIVFIAVIVFLLLAAKNYKKDINYFKDHKLATFSLGIIWLISLLSGVGLYIAIYF